MRIIKEIQFVASCADLKHADVWDEMMKNNTPVIYGGADKFWINIDYNIACDLIKSTYPNWLPKNNSNIDLVSMLDYHNPYQGEIAISDKYLIFVHSCVEFFFTYKLK